MSRSSWFRALAPLLLIAALVAGCGGEETDNGAQVRWIEGTPPPDLLAELGVTPAAAPETLPIATIVPTASGDQQPTSASGDEQPTPAPAEPTATATTPPTAAAVVTGERLTDEQLEEFQPNELGMVPILEYHVFTEEKNPEGSYTHNIDDFREELQWLYDNDFYVVPLKDVVLNRIAAPAGKYPVALTFDDSSVGQFRYLIEDDGSVTIDPDSAVGIMEAFFAEHPDFGRGGFFAILPQGDFCFAWQGTEMFSEQTPYCDDKIAWLLDNGYEVGNHTLNHQSLYNVEDDVFRSEIGGAIQALQEHDPRVEANIIAMTFGDYPDLETRANQREWLRNGFEYDGETVQLIGALMVGAEPAYSPVSTEWDPVFIARIQSGTQNEYGYTAYWFDRFEEAPWSLYRSDGNPATITVPEDLPATMDGTLNVDRIEADGLELIRY